MDVDLGNSIDLQLEMESTNEPIMSERFPHSIRVICEFSIPLAFLD